MITEIQTISDICTLAKAGFSDWKHYGDVATDEDGSLVIFSYNRECQFARRWNFFERVSRGLIVDRATGEVVARPFDKFFNWCEVDPKPPWQPKHITEKVDGSLGILYRQAGQYLFATRGSFHSDQAVWATRWLQENKPTFRVSPDVTLLFEIVYPENRVVVDYHGWSGLVLLAARDRFTGEYWSLDDVQGIAAFYNLPMPEVYECDSLEALTARCESLPGDAEGFVVEFENGDRYKFKGAEYLRLHRLICGLSFKSVLEAIASGKGDEYRAELPEEFHGQFDAWAAQIKAVRDSVTEQVLMVYADAPKGDRKTFALWVKAKHPEMSRYLFAALDQKPLYPIIYRHAYSQKAEVA